MPQPTTVSSEMAKRNTPKYDGWTVPAHGNDLLDAISVYYENPERTKLTWWTHTEPHAWIETLEPKTEGIVTIDADGRFAISPLYRGLVVMWFVFSDGDVCIVDWRECRPITIKWEKH